MNLNILCSKRKSILILFLSAILFLQPACTKLVDVGVPSTALSGASAFGSDATANAVLLGIYVQLNVQYVAAAPNIINLSAFAGLSADELTAYSGASGTLTAYYKNALLSGLSLSYGSEIWQNTYPLIYSCNAALEGLNASNSLTPSVKQQLTGEAKFLRAYFYFYLVNLYGDVPLVLTSDYTINASLTRTPVAQVYKQIIKDLQDAQVALADGYVKSDGMTLYPSASAERVRASRASATALLARVYLYTNNFAGADSASSALINNTAYYSLATLDNAFLKNSTEAILQIFPVKTTSITNTADAPFFNFNFSPAGGPSIFHPVYLSPSLLNSFEAGDQRKINGKWINVFTNSSGTFYYANKYKNITTGTGVTPTEYTMVLRLAEQYLIRAEAKAQEGNIAGSQSDLNSIRNRAGLGNTTAADKPSLLTAILHERQVELFTELGHRWLDLKRTGQVDAVMGPGGVCAAKGGSWVTTQQLYPVPYSDILQDPNLVQNPGY